MGEASNIEYVVHEQVGSMGYKCDRKYIIHVTILQGNPEI